MAKKPFNPIKVYDTGKTDLNELPYNVISDTGELLGYASADYVERQAFLQQLQDTGELTADKIYAVEMALENMIKSGELDREDIKSLISEILESMAWDYRTYRIQELAETYKLGKWARRQVDRAEKVIPTGKSGAYVDMTAVDGFIDRLGKVNLFIKNDLAEFAKIIFDDSAISSARNILTDMLEEYFLANTKEEIGGIDVAKLLQDLMVFSIKQINTVNNSISRKRDFLASEEVAVSKKGKQLITLITDRMSNVMISLSSIQAQIETELSIAMDSISRKKGAFVQLSASLDNIFESDLPSVIEQFGEIDRLIEGIELLGWESIKEEGVVTEYRAKVPLAATISDKIAEMGKLGSSGEALFEIENGIITAFIEFYQTRVRNIIADMRSTEEAVGGKYAIATNLSKETLKKFDVFEINAGLIHSSQAEFEVEYVFKVADNLSETLLNLGVGQDLIDSMRAIISREVFGRDNVHSSIVNFFRNTIITRIEGI